MDEKLLLGILISGQHRQTFLVSQVVSRVKEKHKTTLMSSDSGSNYFPVKFPAYQEHRSKRMGGHHALKGNARRSLLAMRGVE